MVLIEHLFYTGRPLSAASTGANRGADPVRRTPLPLQFFVPRWRLGARRPGRASGRAGPDRAGRHGPCRAVRRGPFRDRGRGGGTPPDRRSRDRAARSGRRGSGRDRRPAPPGPPSRIRRSKGLGSCLDRPGGSRSARRPPAARRHRRPARSPEAVARPVARSSGHGQGGPARDRRADPRAAPGPARPIAGRLAEPVPARVAREHGRDQGRPALQPGAPGRAHRRARRAVWLPGRRAGPSLADGRPGRGTGRRGTLRDAVRAGRRCGHQRLLHRAVAPSAGRRRLARVGSGGAGRCARPPGRRHQRRPLRSPRGSRAGGRPGRHPARPDARHARRPAPGGRGVVPQVGCGAGRAGGGRSGIAGGASLGGGAVDRGGAGRVVLDRSRLRAVPLPGLPGAGRGDPVLVPVGAVLGGRPEALPPGDLPGRQAAGPRAGGHRASRPRRVLPHLLGPHALREGTGDPGPGSGQRDQLDRVVHARDQPGRADRPQPPVRAVHQSRPNDLPGRRHRLQLGAARGGHPVRLRPLRPRAHGDGLQPGHVPGTLGGARGGLRARVPATARGPCREGARDV